MCPVFSVYCAQKDLLVNYSVSQDVLFFMVDNTRLEMPQTFLLVFLWPRLCRTKDSVMLRKLIGRALTGRNSDDGLNGLT